MSGATSTPSRPPTASEVGRLPVPPSTTTARSVVSPHATQFFIIDFELIRQSNDNLAVGTPAEFVRLLAALWQGRLLDPAHRDGVLEIMRIQKYIEPIRRYLLFNPYAAEFGEPQDLWIASKTGGLSGVRCESGLIGAGDTVYALSVMGKECQDRSLGSDSEGTLAIATASELVYRYWIGETGSEEDLTR